MQHVEVVWTGPASQVRTSRLTGPTVVELIKGARRELLLVSFSSAEDSRLLDAVADAVERQVEVTVLFERATDNGAFGGTGGAFEDLAVRRWIWPASQRPAGANLHAKLLVADRSVALLGSANLTARAMDANLECGVLIRGGPHPAAIAEHLWSLHRQGVLSNLR